MKKVYTVSYPRTANWWSGGWYEISTWCNNMIGVHEWDYVNEKFIFLELDNKILFELSWM